MPSLLAPRDSLADARNTLSSWNNCMGKSYCKYPVIVAIVLAALIVLSLVLCLARCICCGAELTCCCFKCCSCCCPSGRSKPKRTKEDPPPAGYPAPIYNAAPPAHAPVDTRPLNQQYRSHAAPAFNPAPKPEAPQFARFESPTKPINEDALPPMPSWKDAKSSHVEEEVIPEQRGDLEMDRLHHSGSVAPTSAAGAAGAGAPRRSPGPGGPPVQRLQTQDPYGFPPGYHNDSFVSNAPLPGPRRSLGSQGRYYGQPQADHPGVSPIQPISPVYGGPDYAQTQPYDRRSPGPGHVQQPDRESSPSYSQPPVDANTYGYAEPQPQAPPLVPGTGGYRNDSYAFTGSPSPGYVPPEPARYAASPAPSYPGQQTYGAPGQGYPGQQTYQAFAPGQHQGQQSSAVTGRPGEGTWNER